MTKEEILAKAKYIQFPYYNKQYKDYSNLNIVKLPILSNTDNILYTGLLNNEHHYTTLYSISYVLPILNTMFNFGFDVNDFKLTENIYIDDNENCFDLSYLVPKKVYNYTFINLITDKIYENLTYNELINNKNICSIDSPYHSLFVGAHSCSLLVNNDISTNMQLLISCDSQIIPSVLPLSIYYKKICILDNRTGIYTNKNGIIQRDIEHTSEIINKVNNIKFDDVLIELYYNPLEYYIDINLK